MKTFRLIVATRLALFPLIFNLSVAQEVEAIINESSFGTEGEESYVQIDNFNTQDSSLNAQNDDGNDYDFLLDKGGGPLAVEDLKIQENETLLDSSTSSQNDKDCVETTHKSSASKASFGFTTLSGAGLPSQGANLPLCEERGTACGGEVVEETVQDSSLRSEGQEESAIPNLIITEVFWLGSGEWIEVTNISDTDFYGELVFSGGKSSGNQPKSVANIPSYESVIISNSENIGILSGTISLLSPKSSISDREAFSITLLNSGNILDYFSVDKKTVTGNYVASGKPRPSFQKIYNNGREIQISIESDLYNITGNYIANPGKIVIKSGNPWIGDGPSVYPPIQSDSGGGNDSGNSNEPGNGGNSGSGDNPGNENETGGSSDFNLIISEVYYDDEDERIEIYNIGSGAFYGDLTISGKIFSNEQTEYTYQNIQIPANDFLIIADSDEMFQNINILENGEIYPKFYIPDDEEIQISLILSGDTADSFFAHQYWVDKNKGKKESIHKIQTPTGFIVTRALFSNEGDDVNISQMFIDEITATPGKLTVTYEDTAKDYSKDPNQQDEINEDDNNFQIGNCGNVDDSPVTISEIFRGGSRYEPYVEFDINEDIQQEYELLSLSGNILNLPLTLDLYDETETFDQDKLEKNTKLILTTKAGELTEAGLITIVLQPDLKFNYFSGELELFGYDGQSRQVLDIVKITTGSLEKSTYTAGSNHRCGINMDNVMDFSPGFDESALKYFSTTSKYNEKIVETVKYVGGGGGCSCPSKEQICGTATGNAVKTGDSQKPPFDKGGAEGNEAEGFNTGNTQEIPPTPLIKGAIRRMGGLYPLPKGGKKFQNDRL